MKILLLHGWQSVPGGVKPTSLAQHVREVVNPKLPDEGEEGSRNEGVGRRPPPSRHDDRPRSQTLVICRGRRKAWPIRKGEQDKQCGKLNLFFRLGPPPTLPVRTSTGKLLPPPDVHGLL